MRNSQDREVEEKNIESREKEREGEMKSDK